MKCPVCSEPDLLMSERQGVEIDYCPKCRGVWLDRGELDKIIANSTGSAAFGPGARDNNNRDRDDDEDDDFGGRRPGKQRSWLGELFD